MKTNNPTVNPAETPEVAAVIPPAFEAHAPGMKPMTLQLAIQLGQKHPDIVKAVLEFREAYGRAGEKYFGMASSLRASRLPKKESTALLLGLGLSKSRVSEIIRVSAVSDAIWNQYSAKSIGFKAAMQLEAGKEESSDGGTKPGEKPDKPDDKAKVKFYDVPPGVRAFLKSAAETWPRPLKNEKTTEYVFNFQENTKAVAFYFAISAIPA